MTLRFEIIGDNVWGKNLKCWLIPSEILTTKKSYYFGPLIEIPCSMLTLSWWRSLSCRNQSIDLLWKSGSVFFIIGNSVMKELRKKTFLFLSFVLNFCFYSFYLSLWTIYNYRYSPKPIKDTIANIGMIGRGWAHQIKHPKNLRYHLIPSETLNQGILQSDWSRGF